MTAPAVAAGQALIAALVDAGVTDVVLAPGSRSAPLAVAAARAEQAGDLELHVRVDERSAGFLALGIAKVSGRPAVVVCTSGTAVANLMPAVVEARYAGVPLLVITADRPPELRARGASQTIDQVGLFDRFVVGSRDLPVPHGSDDAAEWQRAARAALLLAARTRAPVHLNAPFRPPLVAPAGDIVPDPLTTPEPADGDEADPADPSEDLGELPARGLIIAGDIGLADAAAGEAVAALGEQLSWPVVWEATSGLSGAPTAIAHGTLMLGDPAIRGRLRPRFVLTVGRFGLDRGVLSTVRDADRHVSVRLDPRGDPPDPVATAELIVQQIPRGCIASADPQWLAQWRTISRDVATVVDTTVTAGGATAAAVAAQVWRGTPPGDLLLVAASQSVRHVAALAAVPGPRAIANRGANGIDGLVSTAWGAAAAWRTGRTVALLGDLAFLHDRNGLLAPRSEPRPDLTIVVADNNGGGIFATLEQGGAATADVFDRVFGTPHDIDLVAATRAAGVPVSLAPSEELPELLADRSGGMRVIVVRAGDYRHEAAVLADLAGRIAALPA